MVIPHMIIRWSLNNMLYNVFWRELATTVTTEYPVATFIDSFYVTTEYPVVPFVASSYV